MNTTTDDRPDPPDLPTAPELKAEYEAGATVRDLARKYVRGYSAIYSTLTRAGTQFRTPGGAGRRKEPAG